MEAKLDVIIGKQNESLALANAATAALQAIQGLAAKQLAAQQALEKAVTSQLSAIKTATYSGVISLTQALALWKRARRERALTIKAAKLANVPCNSLPAQVRAARAVRWAGRGARASSPCLLNCAGGCEASRRANGR